MAKVKGAEPLIHFCSINAMDDFNPLCGHQTAAERGSAAEPAGFNFIFGVHNFDPERQIRDATQNLGGGLLVGLDKAGQSLVGARKICWFA